MKKKLLILFSAIAVLLSVLLCGCDIVVEEYIDTVEYDYPVFHLSMRCYFCKLVSGKLTLDKDFLQHNKSNKVYSSETCCWIDMKNQGLLVDHELAKDSYKKYVTRVYLNGKIEVFKGIKRYSKDKKLSDYKILPRRS